MQIRRRVVSQEILYASLIAACGPALFAGCERCQGETPLVESVEAAGTDALPWERVELGADVGEFEAALGALAGLEPSRESKAITCVDQSAIAVVDPEAGRADERPVTDGSLSNCALLQAGEGRSWRLSSAKGEFLAGRLVSATFDFAADYRVRLSAELTSRFGPGEERTLAWSSLLGEEREAVTVWKVRGASWVLLGKERFARLIHQDTARLLALPKPAKQARPGVPVSLDDIGLGGGLDLSGKDLDDIPIPVLPDAGAPSPRVD